MGRDNKESIELLKFETAKKIGSLVTKSDFRDMVYVVKKAFFRQENIIIKFCKENTARIETFGGHYTLIIYIYEYNSEYYIHFELKHENKSEIVGKRLVLDIEYLKIHSNKLMPIFNVVRYNTDIDKEFVIENFKYLI